MKLVPCKPEATISYYFPQLRDALRHQILASSARVQILLLSMSMLQFAAL